MYRQHSFCSYCGRPFSERNQGWPRVCEYCHSTTYRNPLPVVLVVQPVDDGLLVIRRAAAPRKGQLALPGGFIEIHETWQHAAARELQEETGVIINPAEIVDFGVRSTNDGYLLVFGMGPPLRSRSLPEFGLSRESSERLVVNQPVELAFPLHTEAVARFFARRS
jgi:ADP-ribose pyrophosphatase YjhB (NUDIX family)